MDLTYLTANPKLLNKETLYELRCLTALYPYYQPARLLLLRNLYLLHDTSFDEELRRAALYLSDRATIFQLVEAAHYELKRPKVAPKAEQPQQHDGNRTLVLIDSFLDQMPKSDEEEQPKKRKPTPADAAVDYVSYLLETESAMEESKKDESPQLKGHTLIDDFINKDGGKITLKDDPELKPQLDEAHDKGEVDETYFTETLAKIYIAQGKYSKALEIIERLDLNYPKKNAYFADQIRFLKKLIINNNIND